MALQIAFLDKEKNEYRKKELLTKLKEIYLNEEYEKTMELKISNLQIPQNFNIQKNLFKTLFIPNSLKN